MYRWVWESFRRGAFTICVSNEIIDEYEELLSRLYPPEITETTMRLLLGSRNIEKVVPYYKWNLISADLDDNKFVDCAINAGADYIVTNDRHFNILKNIEFPPVKIIGIDAFKSIMRLNN
jgi:predicted nucleic acid-binding protein